MRLKKLVERQQEVHAEGIELSELVRRRVREWADDGKTLPQIEAETGFSKRHILGSGGRSRADDLLERLGEG